MTASTGALRIHTRITRSTESVCKCLIAGAGQGVFKAWMLLMKNVSLRFAMGLEQIESSWCPLKHFGTRRGVVYPEHHGNFFGPDELEEMREVLRTEGTVSARKPRY